MMFRTPEEHAANPPETWIAVKVSHWWKLQTKSGAMLGKFDVKRQAEAARTVGFFAELYAKEGRWFAGEHVDGWKPYAKSVAG